MHPNPKIDVEGWSELFLGEGSVVELTSGNTDDWYQIKIAKGLRARWKSKEVSIR